MKIQDGATGGPASSRPAGPRTRAEGAAATGAVCGGGDQVSLTGRGAEIQKAQALARQAPEVRVSLVRELRERIERGQYRVSGAEVLPRLLREQMLGAGG